MFRIDHDENLQPDHPPAIPAVEERAMVRLQLALRQRSGCWPGALRGRQLQQRAERDRHNRGCLRPDSGPAVRGGPVLREACLATPTTPISRNGLCPASQYGSKYVSDSRRRVRKTTIIIRRASNRAILFDLAVGDDNLFHGEKYKWSARLHSRQSDEQRGALQFPIDIQRNALCYAADGHRDDRFPLLAHGSWHASADKTAEDKPAKTGGRPRGDRLFHYMRGFVANTPRCPKQPA